ncbi:MAG: LysR family transcriptional regulator [Myxococcales bacterium]|nr:LysR family transcriptional regulator [Myxococcales bacterium]MCB9701833.1 LysR family transcriptional regulator [Myxococcales bacterium]
MSSDLFEGLVPFVHAAEERSFRRAAERLGVTPAAISKAVLRLEERLGVRLLERTTRQVRLTDEGALYLARCREAMAQVEAGRDAIARAQGVPRGSLTVSLPFVLGRALVRQLPRFTALYPGVDVHLRLSDRRTRLVDERIDVAIRVGELQDSGLIARRIMDTRWVTVGAPAYLARRGAPQRPDELHAHACLSFRSPRGKTIPWTFVGPDGAAETLAVAGPVDTDQGELLLEGALAGLGLAQVFDFMLADHLRQGRLLEVLAPFAAAGPAIHAVYLPSQRQNQKIRAFLDFLIEDLARPEGTAARAR